MTTHLPTPPHDLLACSRTALARGSVTRGARARSIEDQRFPWEGLGSQRWRERDGRDKPTTSTKRSGQFPRNPNPHRSVIPKRGHVTQRSGASPSPKSNFAAFSGKGHEVIFEFHASPYRGVSPRRRISLALLQPTPGDSTQAATRWCERISGSF